MTSQINEFLQNTGTFGTVNVTWRFTLGNGLTHGSNISDISNTQTVGTVTFQPGHRRKTLTIKFNHDDLPEDDETIMVELESPTNGASIDTKRDSLQFIIEANDDVGGVISFMDGSASKTAREGETVVFSLGRTSPALGTASVTWVIRGVNASQDFVATTGVVVFERVRFVYYKVVVTCQNKLVSPYHGSSTE